MGIVKEKFGTTKEGKDVTAFIISNANGMVAKVIDYGANLVSLLVPDRNGNVEDVVLGYDTLEQYYKNGSFFGALVGPSANRIANAGFEINGTTYQMDINDGPNNLHSDFEKGYHKCMWDAKEGENSVTFTIKDADGSMGLPGNKEMSVTYVLTDANELKLIYHASSDADTIINPTNHTYFNLAGHKAGKIEDHLLCMKASHYTPVVPGAIPTGEIAPVAGTPMDFTVEKTIGQDINADFEQLKLTKGYDHNFVIDDADGTLKEFAKVTDPKTGRSMKVFTDLPGVQFYAGNCISPEKGKEGAEYSSRKGLCLETQYYPDNIHHSNFPQSVFGPGKDYDSVTVYQFI